MDRALEDIPFLGDLSEAEIESFKKDQIDDKQFLAQLNAWRLFTKGIIGDSSQLFEDRSILVCHVLKKNDHEDLLSRDELEKLRSIQDKIDDALRQSSALRAIENRIKGELDDFKEAWAIHEGSTQDSQVKRLESTSENQWQPVVPGGRSSWKLLAACLTILFVGIFAIQSYQTNGPTVIIADAGIENLTLPDGSTVRLIPGSTLRYRLNEEDKFERSVELLEGKAFFDIVKSTNPFTVSTPSAHATVLGTSFGMEASRFFTEVVLAEGSVVLADKNDGSDKVILEPGQMSRVTLEGDVSRPHGVDVVDALHWTEMFIFRSTKVKDALERISDYYGVDIEINTDLADDKINATYDYGVGVDYIVNTISESLGADVQKTTKGFKLTN